MLPVLSISPCGHDGEPEILPLTSAGTVYSHTRVWASDKVSTVIVMADFLEGELRVAAPLLGADDIAIGDAVRAVPGKTTPYALERVLS